MKTLQSIRIHCGYKDLLEFRQTVNDWVEAQLDQAH
jgi:hypothetical protein